MHAHLDFAAQATPEDVRVEISCQPLSLDDDEVRNLVQHHRAGIVIYDDDDKVHRIGELLFDVIDLKAIAVSRQYPLEVMDQTDADGYEMGLAVFELEGLGLNRQAREHAELDYENFMHLRELFIEPAWRGRKLGMTALHILLQRFSRGCDFAVLCASPIRVDVASEASRKRQQKSLRSLYEQAGFKRIGRSLYMIQDLVGYGNTASPFEDD